MEEDSRRNTTGINAGTNIVSGVCERRTRGYKYTRESIRRRIKSEDDCNGIEEDLNTLHKCSKT